MEILDAVIKAMKVYWNKEKEFESLQTSQGDRKYTKKYFDGVEKTFLTAKDVKDTKKYTKPSDTVTTKLASKEKIQNG